MVFVHAVVIFEICCVVQGVSSPSYRKADQIFNATPSRISSHPVPSPEPSSHAIEHGDEDVSSHALQYSSSSSPHSSVGSVSGFPRELPPSPLTAPAARNHLPTPRHISISPFGQPFSGADGLDTPQKSTVTGGSDLISHEIQHSASDSGSGNDAVDSAATSPQSK